MISKCSSKQEVEKGDKMDEEHVKLQKDFEDQMKELDAMQNNMNQEESVG